jgi:hypothetical protein
MYCEYLKEQAISSTFYTMKLICVALFGLLGLAMARPLAAPLDEGQLDLLSMSCNH